MAKSSGQKPQMEQKHPEPWRSDLNPDHMAGQNIRPEPAAPRTAYDVKDVHRALRGFRDDELRRIPLLEAGTRLQQGATYLDLDQGEFIATGVMHVRGGQKVVPKDAVHYETWNRLIGEEKG